MSKLDGGWKAFGCQGVDETVGQIEFCLTSFALLNRAFLIANGDIELLFQFLDLSIQLSNALFHRPQLLVCLLQLQIGFFQIFSLRFDLGSNAVDEHSSQQQQ